MGTRRYDYTKCNDVMPVHRKTHEEKEWSTLSTQDFKLIGLQIRNFREEKNISQEQLANQAGLATGTIGKIERGLINPKAETLIRIAHELEVPCQLLFASYDNDKNNTMLSPQLHRLIQYARHLSEDDINILCIVAQTLQARSHSGKSTVHI